MAAKPAPAFPPPGTLKARVVVGLTKLQVLAYRLSGGRIMNGEQDVELVVLHTVGRKSGKPRTTPLYYVRDGDDYVVVASRGGSDEPPAWWLNLKADPAAEIEIKGKRTRVSARTATPEEKARLWPRLVAGYSFFEDYQQRTQRDIAVVVLTPVA